MAELVEADTDCLQTGREGRHKEVRVSAQLADGQGLCPVQAGSMVHPEQNVLAVFFFVCEVQWGRERDDRRLTATKTITHFPLLFDQSLQTA